MISSRVKEFKPIGAVASAYLADRASKVKLLRGPYASGKTVLNIMDGIYATALTMPICRDGQIHFKDAIIGGTYGQLERNLYPSWHYWLPKEGSWFEGEWEGGGGRFAQQTLHFGVPRGPGGARVQVNYTAIFSAIGELSVEQFVRGFEPSAWYLFELDQLPEGIIEQAAGRLGRFPNPDMLPDGVTWKGYIRGDLNSPDIDSWYYKLIEEVRPAGIKQYVQPSGLSARAEGRVIQLDPDYYRNLAEQNKHKPRWVRRFILNEYGPSDAGEPVYVEWSDDVHLSREALKPLPGRPLLIGLDQGVTQPAATISQRAGNGQLRVLAELVPGRMNARRFAERLKQLIGEIASGFAIGGAWADPAGFTGVDREAGELAWAEIVGRELDFPVQPAPAQEIDLRLTAVKDELTHIIDGSTPALLVSGPGCPMLRKGFASHYMFEKRPQEKSQALVPLKNLWSNPQDALQYQILGEKGRYGVIQGKRGKSSAAGWGTGQSTKIKSDFLEGW